LQRQHEYIANSRKDFLNKVAHSLIARYDFIAIEDLQNKGMIRNRHISKSILDAGWRYLKQRLVDKAAEAGRQVVLVHQAYTSKTCSSCDVLFEGLSLADRWMECSCGLSMGRDVNAALNTLAQARSASVLWVGQTHWGKKHTQSPRAVPGSHAAAPHLRFGAGVAAVECHKALRMLDLCLFLG
jgi:IS605 OrfB family transposase